MFTTFVKTSEENNTAQYINITCSVKSAPFSWKEAIFSLVCLYLTICTVLRKFSQTFSVNGSLMASLYTHENTQDEITSGCVDEKKLG